MVPLRAFHGDSAEEGGHEPIAVIGLACRFPGAPSAEAFWKLLIEGRDAIGPMPADRFDPRIFDDTEPGSAGMIATRRGGFLTDVDLFDAGFFGISPREAHLIDPQQRLLLEMTQEALEDAGLSAAALAASATGVFVGLWTDDYERLAAPPGTDIDLYATTGTGRYAASGRISYALDLRGPSLTVDTACSSSLVAIHLACQSLRSGESSLAIVGAANLILEPLISVGYSRSGLLSREGVCRFGDRHAAGYVRSEGVAAVILKRLSRAEASGDRVRAVIRGSAVNNDGRGSGLLVAPSTAAQAEMLRAAYADAGIDPREVQYVEAHGTGTRIGDPVELSALADVIGGGRTNGRCLVGSVKSNIGHSEAASGFAGLIKVALALERGVIPASLHVVEPTPSVAWDTLPLALCTEQTEWPEVRGRRLAGVSSYGITGTNAHVVVEQAPEVPDATSSSERCCLVPLSANSDAALRSLAAHWQSFDWRTTPLQDISFTASVRRTHYPRRLAVVATSAEELQSQLAVRVGGELPSGLADGPPQTVFVFPGQGSQWAGMGRQLLASEPAARQTLDACDAAIRAFSGFSVREVVERGDARDFDDIGVVQPLLFALQVMLARVWMSWGIQPAACIGHSMGEVAASHIAGALSLDDAARIICTRSALLRRKRGQGAMALIEAPAAQTEQLLEPFADCLSVAVINSDRSTVVSGEPRAVEQLLASLETSGIFCRPVKVDVASHSPQMDDLLDPLTESLTCLRPGESQHRIYSTVSGDLLDGRELGARYWSKNLRSPVQFAAACRSAVRDGHRAFVEISPHPLLVPAITDTVAGAGGAAVPCVVPSLRRDCDERRAMLESLGALYEAGCNPDWLALHPQRGRIVSLPTYPWQRERFWTDHRNERNARLGSSNGHARGLLASAADITPADVVGRSYWTTLIGTASHPMLAAHRVSGSTVAPAALFAVLTAEALTALGSKDFRVDNLIVHEALALDEGGYEVQIVADRPAGLQTTVRIYSRRPGNGTDGWTLHCTATAGRRAGASAGEDIRPDAFDGSTLSGDDVYKIFQRRRLDYGDRFRRIAAASQRNGGVWTRIAAETSQASRPDWTSQVSSFDACLQSVVLSLDAGPEETWVPVEIRGLQIVEWPSHDEEMVCRVRPSVGGTESGDHVADMVLFGSDGRLLMRADGVVLARLDKGIDRLLYRLVWERLDLGAAPAADPADVSGAWVVFDDQTSIGFALVPEPMRGRATRLAAAHQGDIAAVLASVASQSNGPLNVVHAWHLDLGSEATPEAFARARELGLASILHAARAISAHRGGGRLVIVTSGAQNVEGTEDVVIVQAPAWGLASVVRAEHPEIVCITLDLDPSDRGDVAAVGRALASLGESDSVAIRGGQLFAQRLRVLGQPSARSLPSRRRGVDERFRFVSFRPGLLESIEPVPLDPGGLAPHEVEIEVSRTGLNFMNVMSGLGIYPGYDSGSGPLGIECVGRVIRCGERTSGVEVGERVVAFAFNCLGSHVATDARLVAPAPEHLIDDLAATIPIAFVTAHYSLLRLGRLQPGERVLIHSGAGGVGLAAIQIARRAGAEVLATAGSEEKREYLRGLGIEHVFDSHSTQFADRVREATNGEGVDVVLNSLAGDAIDAGLSVLRSGGRFIEIGKRDIYQNRSVGLGAFRANISYHAVDLDRMAREDPATVGELLRKVMVLADQGRIEPLPCQTYPAARVVDAFKDMAAGRHIGKLVIDLVETQDLMVRPTSSWTGRRAPTSSPAVWGLWDSLLLSGWCAAAHALSCLPVGAHQTLRRARLSQPSNSAVPRFKWSRLMCRTARMSSALLRRRDTWRNPSAACSMPPDSLTMA